MGLARDPERALALHDKYNARPADTQASCDAGTACAMAGIAAAKMGGAAAEQADRARIAPEIVSHECSAGALSACEAMASYYSGHGAARDAVKAEAYARRATQIVDGDCASGDQEACKSLAIRLLTGQDVQRGRRMLEPSCGGGDLDACNALGRAFGPDSGSPDAQLSDAYFRRSFAINDAACAAGNEQACMNVASEYMAAEGVAENLPKSEEYWAKAGRIAAARNAPPR